MNGFKGLTRLPFSGSDGQQQKLMYTTTEQFNYGYFGKGNTTMGMGFVFGQDFGLKKNGGVGTTKRLSIDGLVDDGNCLNLRPDFIWENRSGTEEKENL